jgi:hypothetical protein
LPRLAERLEVSWRGFNSQMKDSMVEVGRLFMDMTRLFSNYMGEADDISRLVDLLVGINLKQPICMNTPDNGTFLVMSLPISIKNAIL